MLCPNNKKKTLPPKKEKKNGKKTVYIVFCKMNWKCLDFLNQLFVWSQAQFSRGVCLFQRDVDWKGIGFSPPIRDRFSHKSVRLIHRLPRTLVVCVVKHRSHLKPDAWYYLSSELIAAAVIDVTRRQTQSRKGLENKKTPENSSSKFVLRELQFKDH